MKRENLGTMIAKLRKNKDLTQKELADLLYVSSSTVSKWEKGISVPDVYLFTKLAEILGVSASELMESMKEETESIASCTVDEGVEYDIDNNDVEESEENIQHIFEKIGGIDGTGVKKRKKIFAVLIVLFMVLVSFVVLLFVIKNNGLIHINQSQYPSLKIVDEFLSTDADYFGYSDVYYIVIEYNGEITTDYIQEYRNEIRIIHEEQLEKADLLLVLFVDNYLGMDSIQAPDYELALYPSMIG